MGFEVVGSTVALEFAEGTVLAGAHIECSLDATLRDYLNLQRELAALGADADIDQMERVYRLFGDIALRAWDLMLNGEELPATGEGLLRVPFSAAIAIFGAWSAAMKGESPNSSGASANGGQSEAPLEEMAALSQSLGS